MITELERIIPSVLSESLKQPAMADLDDLVIFEDEAHLVGPFMRLQQLMAVIQNYEGARPFRTRLHRLFSQVYGKPPTIDSFYAPAKAISQSDQRVHLAIERDRRNLVVISINLNPHGKPAYILTRPDIENPNAIRLLTTSYHQENSPEQGQLAYGVLKFLASEDHELTFDSIDKNHPGRGMASYYIPLLG